MQAIKANFRGGNRRHDKAPPRTIPFAPPQEHEERLYEQAQVSQLP